MLWLARGDQWITSPTCPKKYTVHEAKDVTKNRPPLASFHATLVKSHIGPTHPCFCILLLGLTFLPRLTPLPSLHPPFIRHFPGTPHSALRTPLADHLPATSYQLPVRQFTTSGHLEFLSSASCHAFLFQRDSKDSFTVPGNI